MGNRPEDRGLDLSRGYLPAIIVFALIVGVAAASYQVGNIMKGLEIDKQSTTAKFVSLENQIAEIKTILVSRPPCASREAAK